jgi:LmbE family N-acetylglucosaminyl deacetylase
VTAGEVLPALAALPIGTLEDVTLGGGLVVVAPHPDDESLGCGGLIAAACAAGVAVRLVVVSDGVGSHPNSRRYPPAKLRALREDETREAAAALGLSTEAITFLRLPDRHVPTHGAEADAAIDAIVAAARDVRADTLCVTWRHDPHCDHTASAQLVDAAAAGLCARVFAYPVWGWTLPAETEVGAMPAGLRLDVSQHLTAKAAAIAAHRSQTTDLIDDDPDGFRFTPEKLAPFLDRYEYVFRVP